MKIEQNLHLIGIEEKRILKFINIFFSIGTVTQKLFINQDLKPKRWRNAKLSYQIS